MEQASIMKLKLLHRVVLAAAVATLLFASLKISTQGVVVPAWTAVEATFMMDNSLLTRAATAAVTTPNYKFAGIFLVAGCEPERSNYRGFLYNTIAAAYMLRKSSMDIHVMIRMSAFTKAERLPFEDEELLRKANITTRYLRKTDDDTFFTAMMDKFVALEYVQYDRVLFMDADVLPVCNLDYLLKHSMTGKLKPNVVIQWKQEPASGGFFIIQPGKKDRFDQIVEARRKRQANETEYFDSYWGWGQPMYHEWETMRKRKGSNWTFYGAYADQGMLYHWVLYEQQNVSVIGPDTILHYGPGPNGRSILEETAPNFLQPCTPGGWINLPNNRGKNFTPYVNFYHYSGWDKPWVEYVPTTTSTSDPLQTANAQVLWHSILQRVGQKWNLQFKTNWSTTGKAPLGKGPARKQLDLIHRGIAPSPNRPWKRRKHA